MDPQGNPCRDSFQRFARQADESYRSYRAILGDGRLIPTYLGRDYEEFFSFVLTVGYASSRSIILFIQSGRGTGPKKPRQPRGTRGANSCPAVGGERWEGERHNEPLLILLQDGKGLLSSWGEDRSMCTRCLCAR